MDFAAFDAIRQLAASQFLVRALHVVAEQDVAGSIPEGGCPVASVAAKVGADADALTRVLRLLASRGIFQLDGDQVRNSPQSAFLREDHPASLRAFVRMFAGPLMWNSAGDLRHAVVTGQGVAERIHPAGGLWGYFAAHPDQAAIFDAAMTAKSRAQIGSILAAHDFSKYARIVDVGGGAAHLLRAILQAHPRVTGVLFDLPDVVERVRAAGVPERLELVAGDFFASAIPAGDLTILMEVIHDWDDEASRRILRAVRRSLPPHGRLLLIEIEMTEGATPDWPKMLDLVMLCLFGGRQRTNAEYSALLTSSGFKVGEVRSAPGEVVLIEALPA